MPGMSGRTTVVLSFREEKKKEKKKGEEEEKETSRKFAYVFYCYIKLAFPFNRFMQFDLALGR